MFIAVASLESFAPDLSLDALLLFYLAFVHALQTLCVTSAVHCSPVGVFPCVLFTFEFGHSLFALKNIKIMYFNIHIMYFYIFTAGNTQLEIHNVISSLCF